MDRFFHQPSLVRSRASCRKLRPPSSIRAGLGEAEPAVEPRGGGVAGEHLAAQAAHADLAGVVDQQRQAPPPPPRAAVLGGDHEPPPLRLGAVRPKVVEGDGADRLAVRPRRRTSGRCCRAGSSARGRPGGPRSGTSRVVAEPCPGLRVHAPAVEVGGVRGGDLAQPDHRKASPRRRRSRGQTPPRLAQPSPGCAARPPARCARRAPAPGRPGGPPRPPPDGRGSGAPAAAAPPWSRSRRSRGRTRSSARPRRSGW